LRTDADVPPIGDGLNAAALGGPTLEQEEIADRGYDDTTTIRFRIRTVEWGALPSSLSDMISTVERKAMVPATKRSAFR
jgi:hypothetical protein